MRRTNLARLKREAQAVTTALAKDSELLAQLQQLSLPEGDRQQLVSCVESLSILMGQTLENYRQKGRLLSEIRRILERNGLAGRWGWFVTEVLGLSEDTAYNWCKLWELSNSDPELFERLRANRVRAATVFCISQLLYPTLRDGESAPILRQHLSKIDPRELARLRPDDVRRAYRYLQLASSKLDETVKEKLVNAEVDPSQYRKLERLPKEAQAQVIELWKQNPEQPIKDVVTLVQERQAVELLSTPEQVDCVLFTGHWRSGLEKHLTSRSVQLAFVKTPFKEEWASKHLSELLSIVNRYLAEGGILLLSLMQPVVPQLAKYLPKGLEIGWLFVLHRQNGHHPRLPGINVMSGYTPLVMLYRPPYRTYQNFLVSDIQSYQDAEGLTEESVSAMEQHEVLTARRPNPALRPGQDQPKERLETQEKCLRYYIESYLQPGSTLLHLVCSIQHSFGPSVRLAVRESALKQRAGRLVIVLGV
ncbi:MAG: hypothetical protein NZ482_03700 [Gloeomargarita sp. SKYG98]|nr:hypothetical protein [Gloeomargarita sp. SKYG98]